MWTIYIVDMVIAWYLKWNKPLSIASLALVVKVTWSLCINNLSFVSSSCARRNFLWADDVHVDAGVTAMLLQRA